MVVPAVARKLHVKLLKNYDTAQELAEKSNYNFITGSGNRGIICNGVSYNYVRDALKDLKMENEIKVLRLGFSHPLPPALIKNFLKGCEKVLIVEEGEPYMEEAVKAFAQEEGLTLPINGKTKDLFTRLYEYNPAQVKQCIARYFDLPYTPPQAVDFSDLPEVPQRPPLCVPDVPTGPLILKSKEPLKAWTPYFHRISDATHWACCHHFRQLIFSYAWVLPSVLPVGSPRLTTKK